MILNLWHGKPTLDLGHLHWNSYVGVGNPTSESYVGLWNSNVGIPMSNIGIPTWVFQVQPRNSEAREPTTEDIFKNG